MMEKIVKGHPKSQSTDFVSQNIETLKTLFPTIVKEGKIDIKELQALLGDDVETEDEYYRFTWAGKSMARREANKPSTATLRPDKESSKDWDTTQNIFIEGDNLEVLKLLQKSYANKIKMIYIDPPYNTGKDFVYKDNYNDNLGNYLVITGQLDENGKQISSNSNSESDGRYHSNWLNMIYPRLRLARNLLKEDGVIFISIDDNEVVNLKKVCDEVFGEDNFLTNIIWRRRKTQANLANHIAPVHDYIVTISKDIQNLKLNKIPFGKDYIEKTFKNPDNDPRGVYQTGPLARPANSSNKEYELEMPNGRKITAKWACSQDTFNKLVEENRLVIPRDGEGMPRKKIFLDELDGILPNTWLDNIATNDEAANEISEIFGNNSYFSYPKPIELIKFLTILGSDEDSTILDFFAGSGTTAHSILKLNLETNTNRKFICVQLPEFLEEKSEAYKAGYKTISDITKERIRRAGEKIKSEMKDDLFSGQGKTLDVGFRAFKLDSSNVRAWDGNPDALEDNLFNAGSNIKENRTEEDVLYEILLKYGLDLTMPIEQKAIAGKQVFNIGMGALFICLGDNITTAVAEGIGKWKEELQPATSKVIFKDTGFTDVDKTNSMQILKRYGILEVNTI